VTSLEELRRELAPGDFITVVPAGGAPLAGRLTRLGQLDLDIRPVNQRTPRERASGEVTIPLNTIQSLDRRGDSPRNGAAIGAGIGVGISGAMFAYALVVDRNEMDEWAPLYARAAAVYTGVGALIGWAIDAAHSRPHIRFEPLCVGSTRVSVQPVYRPDRGVGVAVSFSR
jgi:hypothetical protein